MERTSSWLISILIGIFWGFRIIIAISAQTGADFGGFIVFDFNKEIILIFITLLSLVLIFKRKMLGAFIHIITYGYYFGGFLYINLFPMLMKGNTIDRELFLNSTISIFAIILSISVFFDLLIDKIKKSKYTDSKTDWFFDDKKTDRKLDEKADKNQYKIY